MSPSVQFRGFGVVVASRVRTIAREANKLLTPIRAPKLLVYFQINGFILEKCCPHCIMDIIYSMEMSVACSKMHSTVNLPQNLRVYVVK